jgi:hypothetical protein
MQIALAEKCLKVCAMAVAATRAEREGSERTVHCLVCFPALAEDENILKAGEYLKEQGLWLHHLEQVSIFDQTTESTGDREVDEATENMLISGRHFAVLTAPMPVAALSAWRRRAEVRSAVMA